MKEAREILRVDALSEEERKIYKRYLESVRLALSLDDSSRYEGYCDGHIDGRAEGEKIGIEKGIEKGRAEGLAEGEKKASLENARKMKLKGFSVEDIIDVTGLSKNEIENLR